jgi:23S rRNA pseudouridine955/2504/2580 synthase
MSLDQDPIKHEPARMIQVEQDRIGQRIDNFLMLELKGVPKSRVYQMIRKGEVRVNKGRKKPDYKLQSHDLIRVPPIRRAAETEPVDYRYITILEHIFFENDEFLAINKPAGLAVHGGTGLQAGLIEALRSHRSAAPYLELAHRLDRDTSGLIIIAKKRSFLRRFQAALRSRIHLEKNYDVVVHGQWPKDVKMVALPIQKIELRSGERFSRVREGGKPSQTLFTIKGRSHEATWLSARLVTGRMHQIRLHAAEIGHPVVGDIKYGDEKKDFSLASPRMMLHASSMMLRSDPHAETGSQLPKIRLDAPLEATMRDFIERHFGRV